MRELWVRLIGRGIVIGLCALACVVALSLHTERVAAAGYIVATPSDTGPGSLRDAITQVNAGAGTGDMITITATGTIKLTSGPLPALAKPVAIAGPGAAMLTVQAATTPNTATYRVFLVNSGVTASIANLTIANGHTVGGLGQEGGGIQNNGTLTVTSSTLSGNRAFRPGGGIFNARGGTLTVTSSTLSGSYSLLGGGGIFNAAGGTMTVTNSTLSGNLASAIGDGGGGIENNGTVTVTSSILSGNSAPVGGGILNGGGASLAVTNSTLSSNSATGTPGQPDTGSGGGIDNFGMLTVTSSTLSGNSASGIGGGIDNDSSLDLSTGIATTGTLTVTNSTFNGNSATFNGVSGITRSLGGSGGGIFNSGTLTVTNGTFSGNSATGGSGGGSGGGIYNGDTMTVTNSTFADNSATGGPGGGIYNLSGTMTVTNSTLARNSTSGFDGGGIYNYNGTLTVTNSTLSSNSASGNGGGISNGAATISIYNHNGTMTVTNSTLSGNSAGGSGGGIDNFGMLTVTNSTLSSNSAMTDGGGIFNNSGSTLNLTNTIVASNTNPSSPDISGTITTNDHNLIGGTPLLAALGNYGGPTQTVALLPGSPAIDAGDDTACASTGPAGVNNKDQRGVTRPVGAHCDIGAFESQGFTLTKTSGDGQSTTATTAFTNPLVVTVAPSAAGAADNEPVTGGVVTFTGPTTGAGIVTSPATATIAAGQASITPTANTMAGSYSVTASASGATPVTFSLMNIAPTITLSPTTLPGGVKGIAYPATTLTAAGGTAPYTFSVTTGMLPTGLTLSSGGLLSGNPTAGGAFTFTVTATDANGFTGMQQYTITVSTTAPPTLKSIAFTGPNGTPPPATLKVGQNVAITATGTYSDGSTQNLTGQVQWSSSNAQVAMVDANGKVTGESPGTVTITATLNGVTQTITVTVVPPTPIGITVQPAPASRPGGAKTTGSSAPAPAPLPLGR